MLRIVYKYAHGLAMPWFSGLKQAGVPGMMEQIK
jgi:hypothetical protein